MRTKTTIGLFSAACLAFVHQGCGKQPAEPSQPTKAPQTPALVSLPLLRAEAAFPGLHFERPLLATHAPGYSGRLYVCEQQGRVWAFDNRPEAKPSDRHLALDLTDAALAPGSKTIPGENEEGLLGLAFHPQLQKTCAVFVHYTVAAPGFGGSKDRGHRRGRLSRFTLSADGWTMDRASETVLAEVDQPEGNHNGGMLAFGPDGMLYWGLGDGGGGGDKHGAFGNGQKTDTLLGKILRLDVDHADAAAGLAYAIPKDNPFVGKPGFRGEIWALGLRNPWRFSFDSQTGDLWCGDVGQNKQEEVDIIVRGGNYGWRVREASLPFADQEKPATLPLVEPVAHHDHDPKGGISVTGGHVYRGQTIPDLRGWYIYGDFGTGNLWAMRRTGSSGFEAPQLLPFKISTLSSFGEDAQGEIYACSISEGKIYKLVEDKPVPLPQSAK